MFGQKTFVTIGEPVPSFATDSARGKINFPRDFSGRWLVLIGHPDGCGENCAQDFLELARYYPMFRSQGAELAVLARVSRGVPSILSERVNAEMLRQGVRWTSRDLPLLLNLPDPIADRFGMGVSTRPPSGPVAHVVHFVDPQGSVRGLMYYHQLSTQHLDQVRRILRNLQDQSLTYQEPVYKPDFQPAPAPRPIAPQDDFCVEWCLGGKGPDLHH